MPAFPLREAFRYGSPVPERFLLIRLSAIGDVINTLPALSLLRNARPAANISYVVEDRAAAVAVELDGARTTASIVFRYEVEYGRAVSPTLSNAFTNADVAHDLGDTAAENPTDTVALPQ